MMMKVTGVTLVQTPGKRVPDDVIDKILSRDPSSIGIMYARGNGIIGTLRLPHGIFTREHVNKAQKTVGDKPMIFFFGTGPTDQYQDKDLLQPYTLLSGGEKNEPMLTCVLNGNFDHHAEQGSEKTPDRVFFEEYLQPKIEKMAKYCDGDLDKLAEEFDDKTFASDLMDKMMGDRGSITFFFGDGSAKHICVMGDKNHEQTDYGWISDKTILEDQPQEQPEVEEEPAGDPLEQLEKEIVQQPPKPKAAAGFGARPTATSDQKRDTPDRPVPVHKSTDGGSKGNTRPGSDKQDATPVLPDSLKDRFQLLDDPNAPAPVGWIKAVPKDHVRQDGRQMKKWVKGILGGPIVNQMKDWFYIKAILIKQKEEQKPVTVGKGMEALAAHPAAPKTDTAPAPKANITGPKVNFGAAPKLPAAGNVPASSAPAKTESGYPPKGKDVTPHIIGKSEPKLPAVSVDFIPLIPPETKKQVLELLKLEDVKSMVDRNNQVIMDPLQFQKLEQKVPSFGDEIGMKMDDVAKWPYELYEMIGTKIGIKALAKLCFSLGIKVVGQDIDITQMLEHIDKLEAQINGTDTTGTPHNPPAETKPEAAPAEKPKAAPVQNTNKPKVNFGARPKAVA